MGNQKNELVNQIMAREGVAAYPGSVKAVKYLREKGYKTAVVSSSENCAAVLKAAAIDSLFDLRVDGTTATALTLPGKPEPDMFLTAARQLGVDAKRSIVVEDAIAGVQAGKKGGFGLVIGIARTGNADALKGRGDLVVADLDELFPPRSLKATLCCSVKSRLFPPLSIRTTPFVWWRKSTILFESRKWRPYLH